MQHTLWYINLPSMHEHVVKFPYPRSSGKRKHNGEFFFFFLICHFQRIGITNVTKFEKTRIYFIRDILWQSPSSMLKLPIHSLRLLSKKERYKRIFSSTVFRISWNRKKFRSNVDSHNTWACKRLQTSTGHGLNALRVQYCAQLLNCIVCPLLIMFCVTLLLITGTIGNKFPPISDIYDNFCNSVTQLSNQYIRIKPLVLQSRSLIVTQRSYTNNGSVGANLLLLLISFLYAIISSFVSYPWVYNCLGDQGNVFFVKKSRF